MHATCMYDVCIDIKSLPHNGVAITASANSPFPQSFPSPPAVTSLYLYPVPRRPLTVSEGPVVHQPVSHLRVDGAHCAHVGLAPLAAQVLGLHLEQLQSVHLATGRWTSQGKVGMVDHNTAQRGIIR